MHSGVASLLWGSDAMNPRPVPPPRAPGGSDLASSSVLASALQAASSEFRANVRDSQLGSLAFEGKPPTIAQ